MTTLILPERLAQLDGITLDHGSHFSFDDALIDPQEDPRA